MTATRSWVRARVGGRARIGGCTALLTAALVAAVAPAARAGSFRIDSGEVRVSVPLRPGGAFEARSSALAGRLRAGGARPVVLSGEVVLDLAAIDTGIELRNRHLREDYLDVAKGQGFDKAVLSQIRVAEASGEAFRGRSAFTAVLLLHGVKLTVGGSVEIRAAGASGVHVEATFPLTLTDFGIKPPEYMGVGVGSKVMVRVALTASAAAGDGE
jgi:polyisoprenoid-binding protein YceI